MILCLCSGILESVGYVAGGIGILWWINSKLEEILTEVKKK